jgi:hypothetical protein
MKMMGQAPLGEFLECHHHNLYISMHFDFPALTKAYYWYLRDHFDLSRLYFSCSDFHLIFVFNNVSIHIVIATTIEYIIAVDFAFV